MAAKLQPDPFAAHRAAIRARGHVVNPWRLGYEAARAGEGHLAPPYTVRRSVLLYTQGIRDGDNARRLDRQRALNGDPSARA
jgi:hypothetical protein